MKIGVIGLGYVGLPLAVEFGKKHHTIGYDINPQRICDLRKMVDRTKEVSSDDITASTYLKFTSDSNHLADCNFYIVTVPTPIDDARRPDFGPLLAACETVGSVLKRGDIVVFESTVYPGATEEKCVPVLETVSGLSFNVDFYCGYSPERINPGDKTLRITSIIKVTSGSTPDAARVIDKLYASIIPAGTHLAPSIAVAEAAKVIENTQRDVNIALVNELAIIFERLGLDTSAVLKAASTKWNFLPFVPGLVGGHCIGVDPYYLAYKAEAVGYYPQMILSGRRTNESMSEYVASRLIKRMVSGGAKIAGSNVLIMGLTFKENCPDIRNTQVARVFKNLQGFGLRLDVYDPWVEPEQARLQYGIDMCTSPVSGHYDAVILAVGHQIFKEMGAEKIREFGRDGHVFFDLKCLFPENQSDLRL